ncbi:MurR/RpiR family transcriptional regulator [Candidatus Stoquefichus sp. SB1]|jgi:RpiR family carbohydrate utilization transcriptional regulator|uniref:MurR/RpiR family transcriptional regulator n=1 Tax=Candidatus Stoquefichus sp. SB1 TaxID=1658109 RepID=UPI00067EAC04|nr:MurR/RpiR family transcriptional regulator [Candidatus Stoquefichus sp. SB1]
MAIHNYNEVDILYTLMSYVNVSSSQDMYYTIAHTILTYLEKIPDISINDLADLCYTSPATISRFCKDLNCKSFANFKHEIAIALEISKDEIHLESHDESEAKRNPQFIVDKIYNETIDSLQKVHQSINIHEIDKICHMIHQAKKVHMIGYQFNKIISNDFQMKMLKLRKFIYAFVERGDEIQRLDMIDEDSLVIIITVRARQQLIDSLIEKTCEHHPQILLITMNKEYQNDKIDYIFTIDGTESRYSESSMQGTINFLSLLDLIYVRYGLLYRK